MRNLRNVRYEQWNPQSQERSITATTWDLANDSNFLCTFGPSEEDALIELIRVDPASKYYPSSNFDSHLLIQFQGLYNHYILGCTMPKSRFTL
jgi:hypothetical protein